MGDGEIVDGVDVGDEYFCCVGRTSETGEPGEVHPININNTDVNRRIAFVRIMKLSIFSHCLQHFIRIKRIAQTVTDVVDRDDA